MTPYPKPITSVDDLPKNYDGLAREVFWQHYWEAQGTYKFQPRRPDGTLRTHEEIFSIDTPPPTVSGQLHIGHVYSYTQTDMNARYRRMSGKHVFYPFGFDNNGLPTERLVEKERGIRAHEVSREDFIAMCQEVAGKYETEFIALWKSLALSCDWEQFYTTIDERSRAISQASFIDLYNKGYIYRKVAPTQWDWANQTAVAQAEIEDREVPGSFLTMPFWPLDSPTNSRRDEPLWIATTRPELLPACVAVFMHPDDPRWPEFEGKLVATPLFEVIVPILPSTKVDPEKGTGALMCCTFGDMEDVEHWKHHRLPTRIIFGGDGRIGSVSPLFVEAEGRTVHPSEDGTYTHEASTILTQRWPSARAEQAGKYANELAGKKIKEARQMVRDWILGGFNFPGKTNPELKEITHTVRFSERGDVPIEILVTPQWYVNILDNKEALIEQGRRITWHPEYMRKRYEQWVDGLNADWCISRQRYNGVPIPVWYNEKHEPIVPLASELPVNPITGHSGPLLARLQAEGRIPQQILPETDVMDTWATSSVTMLLNTHFRFDASTPEAIARHGQLFPYDMRPQAHDIIRTWAFYTIAKAYFHFGEIPWKDIVISGHAQDASRAKMSKSKGNTVTPAQMVEKYSADGLRYWSGSVKLGTDTVYDETKLGEGRKLINKLFNATKFALRHLLDYVPDDVGATRASPENQPDSPTTGDARVAPTNAITYPTDLWLISRLNACIEKATAAHEAFEFGDAKQAIEDFFWADLCDNYLEFSKGRLYGEPLAIDAHGDADALRRSAQATLYIAFSSVLRMLAPALPHITEECWSWYFAQWSDKGSIHLEEWPRMIGAADSLSAYAPEGKSETSTSGNDAVEPSSSGLAVRSPELLIHTVSAVRKWKSERGVSIKTPLASVRIYATGERSFSDADLAAILGDLLSTCNAQQAELVAGNVPDGAVTTERNPVAVVCEIAEQA